MPISVISISLKSSTAARCNIAKLTYLLSLSLSMGQCGEKMGVHRLFTKCNYCMYLEKFNGSFFSDKLS